MAKRVIKVGGGKGGVGKTFLAMALIDYHLRAGESVVVVESDSTNSDVAQCYKDRVQTHLIDLETANGWIDFLNVCKDNPEAVIVVNTRAANDKGLESYAKMARNGLRKLERPFVVFWVLNTQRDSVELLHDFIELLPGTEVHGVMNLHCGREDEFEEFRCSDARKTIKQQGGQAITLPVLASYVTDQLYNERKSIEAASEVNFGVGIEIDRWREELDAQLGRILGASGAAQEAA
jgi:hypothetical protein